MKDDFFKFPSTPHLALLGDVDVRGDKVMGEAERTAFLRHELVVEEKIDGANIGISFDFDGNIRIQSRGSYLQLPALGQWKKLEAWLTSRIDALFGGISDTHVLYGEWCYAQHSIFYDNLPDWFLAFDVFDKEKKCFLSTTYRDELIEKMCVSKVPTIASGQFDLPALEKLVSRSKLGEQFAEGLYLRAENPECLVQRAKLVRPEFVQSIGKHWSQSEIRTNRLNAEVHGLVLP